MADDNGNENARWIPDLGALWIATTAAWVLARAWSPSSAPDVPQWCVPCAAVVCIVVTLRTERRRQRGAVRSPWWFWAAYLAAVAWACAYYIEQRGAIVTAELALPTLAVLLTMLPLRLRARERARYRQGAGYR